MDPRLRCAGLVRDINAAQIHVLLEITPRTCWCKTIGLKIESTKCDPFLCHLSTWSLCNDIDANAQRRRTLAEQEINTGKDTIVARSSYSAHCNFTHKFLLNSMTPAISIVTAANIPFRLMQYEHNPDTPNFGLEAVEKLSLSPERVFKTLIFKNNRGQLHVATLPVTHQLNLKSCAALTDSKKAWIADSVEAARVTGYVIGGISPLGHKRELPLIIDQTANEFDSIYVSAGRRGLEIELAADDLACLANARFADIRHD